MNEFTDIVKCCGSFVGFFILLIPVLFWWGDKEDERIDKEERKRYTDNR